LALDRTQNDHLHLKTDIHATLVNNTIFWIFGSLQKTTHVMTPWFQIQGIVQRPRNYSEQHWEYTHFERSRFFVLERFAYFQRLPQERTKLIG
jgi:hypothetical protein